MMLIIDFILMIYIKYIVLTIYYQLIISFVLMIYIKYMISIIYLSLWERSL